jgi:hypothetical protein
VIDPAAADAEDTPDAHGVSPGSAVAASIYGFRDP